MIPVSASSVIVINPMHMGTLPRALSSSSRPSDRRRLRSSGSSIELSIASNAQWLPSILFLQPFWAPRFPVLRDLLLLHLSPDSFCRRFSHEADKLQACMLYCTLKFKAFHYIESISELLIALTFNVFWLSFWRSTPSRCFGVHFRGCCMASGMNSPSA